MATLFFCGNISQGFWCDFSGAVAIFFLGKIFLRMFDVIFSGPVAAIFLKVQQNNTSKHREWVQTYKDTERTGISHYLWGGIPWQPPYVEMWLPHINIFTSPCLFDIHHGLPIL